MYAYPSNQLHQSIGRSRFKPLSDRISIDLRIPIALLKVALHVLRVLLINRALMGSDWYLWETMADGRCEIGKPNRLTSFGWRNMIHI
jgi:hypothetical protein